MAIAASELEQKSGTVIAESAQVKGRIEGDEDLTVCGRVEGTLVLRQTLTVAPSGVVQAEVAVRCAIISGVMTGNVTATESVQLTNEGRMVGDIRAPRVVLAEGASFRGRIDMGPVPASALEHPTAAAEPARAAPPLPVARPAQAAPRPPAVPPRPPPAPRADARPQVGGGIESDGSAPTGLARRKVIVKRNS